PLVDPAGFPRADLDVVALRAARIRVLEIRNDLAAVVDDLKAALERVHACASASADSDPGVDALVHLPLRPFARIDGVAPASPASSAGLRRDDLLLRFGPLTAASFSAASSAAASPLAPLASLVAEYEDRPLQIEVRRADTQALTFSLTPRKGWGGRGLLGCHIVPYSERLR
ncbi:hypothetical protein EW145_g8346, partial [Phellinidium pouzarii]